MALPTIKLNIQNNIYKIPSNGNLIYNYSPFGNLKKSVTSLTDLTNLTLNSNNAEINIDKPIDIDIEEAYDGSANLIINDKVNPLKMINSRFYLTSSTTYDIADRKGNLDTNIYTEENFKIESGLIKTVQSIITVDFLGIYTGGKMPIGNYTFYFKLADSDGNESDFIAESGKVICHIGDINQPTSIRGGNQDENSNKLIKFRLNNLDLAYDYINIYYTRTTGDENNEIIKTYKIDDKFKINKLNTEISITGYENHIIINDNEINIQYTNFDNAKSAENCQNITFIGNITKDYSIYQILEKYSLFITPSISVDENIGNLSYKYTEQFSDTGYEYYNVNNIYYRLGYWEDIYRFGIVYIMNDYTLSPVFNIRGIDNLSSTTTFSLSINNKTIDDEINYSENYIIEETETANENSKGVFKIDGSGINIFNGSDPITPIGIKLTFNGSVINGTTKNSGLKDLTKGFFIVRQKRIPSILTQTVGIATSTKSHTPVIFGTTGTKINKWITESFLKDDANSKPILGNSIFTVDDIVKNALLCPEANIRKSIFNTLFNSTEYKLIKSRYNPTNRIFIDRTNEETQFSLGDLNKTSESLESINTPLTLIEPGIELINIGDYKFCSKAGDATLGYKCLDSSLGDYEDLEISDGALTSQEISDKWSLSKSKLRGEFNTYIACNNNSIQNGTYYNIYEKDFDFTNNWKDYFKVRYNDSSPFMPISDRISWDNLNNSTTSTFYRGDCYINTYTHRMNWNFIDPELPTNKHVVDPYTWYKNYRISKKSSTTINESGTPNQNLTYRKLLQVFTYKDVYEPSFSGETTDTAVIGLIEPDGKKYSKYSEINGIFGSEKINTPDINAVPLGHWVTFKICSNINLAMRDVDFTRPDEEAIHKKKRGFYPLQSMDKQSSLPESDVINNGISKTQGNKYYFEIPDVPFIKSKFSTRIHYSNILQQSSFTNGNRIFESKNYQDYTIEYGSLVKLVEWYGTLIAIMEHGIIMIPVNERAMMANASGENIYVNTENVLPKNPKVISNTYGSLWSDSIVCTPNFIYGIDTVAKKIWRTKGDNLEIISDMKVQKFLNDNIQLTESNKDIQIGINFIKTHYNAFKHDIMFVFNYTSNNVLKSWNLCWNEVLNKWITRYTWIPEFSENINNIFYTFAKDKSIIDDNNFKIWKHGFSGTTDIAGLIKPTIWYNNQEPFEYEFVVIGVQGIQKIFNNLKIISNRAEPESFIYEISGEGYDWSNDRETIITNSSDFEQILNTSTKNKIPHVTVVSDLNDTLTSTILLTHPSIDSLRKINFIKNNKSGEINTQIYQKGCNIKSYGRLVGNMQYVEDSWDIQIQPITFKYIYLKNNTLNITPSNIESKLRDKYIKIRVRYTGKELAIITAIRTLFTLSYA